MTLAIDRRQFLKASVAAGGALALEFSLPAAAGVLDMSKEGEGPEVTHWIVIHPDDRVVIRIARSEMGQGSMTGLAQLVAEELECDWHKVSTEFVSPNQQVKRHRIWGSMSTSGSTAIRTSQDYLRKSGAAAREMLVAAAAAQWKVPASECTVSKGMVSHGKRRVSYGRVAAHVDKLQAPQEPTLKDPKDWTIAGQSVARLDIPDKVLGKPVFGVDVQLPGMLMASIVQCPVFLGKVKSVDDADARKMRGVKGVVKEDDFVAVVADNWWRANEGAKKLKIEWDNGKYGGASSETIVGSFREGLEAKDNAVARKVGDTEGAMQAAAKVIGAEYGSPYLSHATMEPMTCTAWFRKDGMLEVWTSTQDGEASLAAAAQAARLAPEKVEVHKPFSGGAFGRRGAPQDYVRQGVLIARHFPGTPVKMIWSREEDMQHGFYRPASLVRMQAGLDANDNLLALKSVIACPSILAIFAPGALKGGIDFTAVRTLSDAPYTIPNQRCEYAMRNGHVPVGFWRAPGLQNAFYRECFLDEVAHAAGRDPVEFRLAMLPRGDRNRGVLEAVAKAAGWGSALAPGVFRGVAVADGFGSYTAMVAEVSVKDGEVTVHRLVLAIDSGYVVNPDACRAQAEGNAVFNLGQLFQAHTVKDGRIVESNFHDFPLPRMPQTPKVDVVLVPSGGFWGGHGEPGALCVVPSVLNAVFAATGKRVRSLPITERALTT